jgi:splicing factor 3A subunit 1
MPIEVPQDIQSIIEKTSDFVARLGSDFEARIKENERNNPKFEFLNPTSPYHQYYQQRIEFHRKKAGNFSF